MKYNPLKYWALGDLYAVERARTFEELLEAALCILPRLSQPTGMVCGPISSGGEGSVEANLAVFREAIRRLAESGISLFDQMPFEKAIFRLKETPYYLGGDHLLRVFYLPIFESGWIKNLYFLRTWRTSEGAKWEHCQAERLGINIFYLE